MGCNTSKKQKLDHSQENQQNYKQSNNNKQYTPNKFHPKEFGDSVNIKASNGIDSLGRYDNNRGIYQPSGKNQKSIYINKDQIRDQNRKQLGRVDNNGNVRDNTGLVLGKVSKGGTVRDKNGKILGDWKNNNKQLGAALYFFNGGTKQSKSTSKVPSYRR